MTTRRALLVALGAAPFAPRAGLAQAKKSVVIGWLSGSGTREVNAPQLAEFKKEFAALGWTEGTNYVLDERWWSGQENRLPALAEELAARKPAVIVTSPALATAAVAKAAIKTPIVQASGNSPVAMGLASSLARPGRMVTGRTSLVTELSEKYLELLLAAVPKLRRVGFLFGLKGPAYAMHMKNAQRAIERFGIEARFAEAADEEALDRALSLLGLTLPPEIMVRATRVIE